MRTMCIGLMFLLTIVAAQPADAQGARGPNEGGYMWGFGLAGVGMLVGVGIFVMANAESPAADVIGLTLIDELLGLSPLPWATRAPHGSPLQPGCEPRLNLRSFRADPESLRALTGSYENPANGPVRIGAREGRLCMAFRDAPRFDGELLPRSVGQFQPLPADPGVRSLMQEPARFDVRPDGSCAFLLPGFGTWQRP